MKLLILKHETEYIVAMGDTIDCVSLIYQISQKEPILLPVQGHYLENIRSFFPKNANIRYFALPDFNALKTLEKSMPCIRIESGDEYIEKHNIKGHTDINGIYHKAGLKQEKTPILDQIKIIPQYNVPDRPYAFIPEGGSSGYYKIDRKYVNKNLEVIVPPQNALMLKYAEIINNAKEIHCHCTSWWRLIDKIPTKGNLFMHHYARPTRIPPSEFEFSKIWHQIL